MTRGQVGSLCLTCTTFTFATPRRFIPAHSEIVPKRFLKLGSNLGEPFSNAKSIPLGKSVEKSLKGFERG
jgi:hypothetical protein